MSAADLSWMLSRFAEETPGVRHVQTVSSDGFHLASSEGLSQVQAEQFAAVTSGLASLTDSAGEIFGLPAVVRQMIETADGWMLIARVSPRASLAVVADRGADLGLVGYEMTVLSERAGAMLSPDLIAELKNSLAV